MKFIQAPKSQLINDHMIYEDTAYINADLIVHIVKTNKEAKPLDEITATLESIICLQICFMYSAGSSNSWNANYIFHNHAACCRAEDDLFAFLSDLSATKFIFNDQVITKRFTHNS